MYPELTNLLPRHLIKAFRRKYFLRVASLACALLAGLVLIHGLLLVPSYIFAQSEVTRQTAQLTVLNASLHTTEEMQVRARLTKLSTNVAYLNQLATTTAASAALRAVLSVPRTGITLSGFTFTPASGKNAGTMGVSGTAATRDTLRAYALALGQLTFVTNADLPISAYAQDNNIPFTITLTGTLRP
jgi:Tfp pilus assembly protein PilN